MAIWHRDPVTHRPKKIADVSPIRLDMMVDGRLAFDVLPLSPLPNQVLIIGSDPSQSPIYGKIDLSTMVTGVLPIVKTDLVLPLSVGQGGTGALTAAAARTNLELTGAATMGLPVSVANGGTGAVTKIAAVSNLFDMNHAASFGYFLGWSTVGSGAQGGYASLPQVRSLILSGLTANALPYVNASGGMAFTTRTDAGFMGWASNGAPYNMSLTIARQALGFANATYTANSWLYTSTNGLIYYSTSSAGAIRLLGFNASNVPTHFSPQDIRNAAGLGNTVGVLPIANGGTGNATGNAATVGGFAVSNGDNRSANQIARTQANGYLHCGYINCAPATVPQSANAISNIWYETGSDGYIRKCSPERLNTVHYHNYLANSIYASNVGAWLMSTSNGTFYTNATYNIGSSSNRCGTIYASAALNTSDRREKEDIEDISFAQNFIMELKPKRFTLKADKTKKLCFGFIAQDVRDIFSELGVSNTQMLITDVAKEYCNEEGDPLIDITTATEDQVVYSMAYTEFIGPLVAFVQLQQNKIDELESRINVLEAA